MVQTSQGSNASATHLTVAEQAAMQPAAVQRQTNILVAITNLVISGWATLVDIARAALMGTAPVAPLAAALIAVATVANRLDLLGLQPVSFHIAGLAFDKVHPEGAEQTLTSMQTTLVPPAEPP